MKRIAIALTALALTVPGAFAQTGGGSAGSGGSGGSSGGGTGAGGTAGSGQIGSSGQAGTGQSGLGGQTGSQAGSQSGGQSRPSTAGDAQLRDQSESRIGGQTDSGLGGQSDSRTGGESRFGQDGFRSGAGAEPGGRPGSRRDSRDGLQPGGQPGSGLDGRDGLRPGGDIDRFGRRTDSRFDDGRRGTGFGDRRFDEPRTFEEGFDELGRGSRGDGEFSGSRRTDRQQRVQWISGRWWFQRNSGEWLVYDQQGRQWQPFHPRVLEGGSSGGMLR